MTITTPRLPDRQRPQAGRPHGDQGHGGHPDDRQRDPRILRRRRLLVWSALPAVVALGVAAKLLSLGIFAGQAATAFDGKDAGAAKSAAGWLQPLNIPEPHKAPFAAGDADVLGGDFDSARQQFTAALERVPEEATADACVIRVNLVLATERLGDAKLSAEEPSSAAALFSEALATAQEAPDGCFPPAGADDASAEAGDRLQQAEQRLAGKVAAAGDGQDGSQDPGAKTGPTDQATESPQQGQLDQLEESARQSQRERNTGRQREDYLNDGYTPGPDRPW